MKTLVIHPKDVTTRFLALIYFGRDWTVITEDKSEEYLKEQIAAHDRIIMLGHGLPFGLLGFGRIIINETFVPLLKEKSVVCIWCNADVFVRTYELKGFYTGMIISEHDEAKMFKINPEPQELLDSNLLFAEAIREAIDKEDMVELVKSRYNGTTPLYQFNQERIYSNF